MEYSAISLRSPRASVVYTGPHDTDTCQGWFDTASQEEKEDYFRYLGRRADRDVAWEFIRMAEISVADTAILQLQDVLGLGKEARMNTPGGTGGNWLWRYRPENLTRQLSARLAEITKVYDRS
ncbi:4-alpha-glucanotransferase [Geomesophilobacter sediminis]|uniref:4-alpha-glucanotransferase n=1 Tax=Geomesophilobacter sediminis TaxID=2798584 RepID=A0A8J7M537_9BACT|nr:4-alpha-glucanotransferase [Geomesophilobacter sediminis]MBJ6728028.1 4-alpha-glucanotransferase [Geomesophilobacter sediminis]